MDVGLAVDVVVLAGRGSDRRVLMIRRVDEPYPGLWALPGGHPEDREPFALAARMALAATTGLVVPYLGQPFGAYDEPGRFAPDHAVAVAFLHRLVQPATLRPCGVEAMWQPVLGAQRAPTGAVFEHQRIIGDAVALLRQRAK